MDLTPRTALEFHIQRQIRWLVSELKELQQMQPAPMAPPRPAAPPAAPPPRPPAPPVAPPAEPADDDPTDWMREALDDKNFAEWLRLRREGVL